MLLVTAWYMRMALVVTMTLMVITMSSRAFYIPSHDVSFMSSSSKRQGVFLMDINRRVIAPYLREAIIGRQTDMTWSPDFSTVVFRAVQNITIDLYATDIDGQLRQQVTGTGKNNHSPAFSPDGEWLAFTSERDGNPEIYVMHTACLHTSIRCQDADAIRLTNNPFVDDQAAWSPDSRQIIFQSNRDGDFEIYSMNRDGSQPRRLTNNPRRDLQPNWSPDGSTIAFISERDINAELYLMNVDGSQPSRMTTTPEFEFTPQWSPDGEQILFQRIAAGSDFETYIMGKDGQHVQRLTTVQMFLQNPVWHS
jgi:TolB protein